MGDIYEERSKYDTNNDRYNIIHACDEIRINFLKELASLLGNSKTYICKLNDKLFEEFKYEVKKFFPNTWKMKYIINGELYYFRVHGNFIGVSKKDFPVIDSLEPF